MKGLKWEKGTGQLWECLGLTDEQTLRIQDTILRLIDEGQSMKEVIDYMRDYCLTDEEFTAFIFSLGHWQGSVMPFGFKMT